jgi:hypothetical protein
VNHGMGKSDRLARGLLVDPLTVILATVVGAGSELGIVLLAVAAIVALTAVVRMCPLYGVLGISTQRHARG